MKFRLLILSSVLIFFISACGIFKKRVNNRNVKIETEIDSNKDEMSLLIDSINRTVFQYETIQANFSGNYDDPTSHIPLKGILRMKHNSFIWISIRPVMAIEVSRIFITRDSIQIMDRLNNQYYSEGYDYIESKFKIKSDFYMLESILSGNLFFYPEYNSYKDYHKGNSDSTIDFSIYKQAISEDPGSKHMMTINKNTFQLRDNLILFPAKQERMQFTYSDYKGYEKKHYYSTIKITGENGKEKINFECTLSNFIFNSELTSPFKVPESYKRIKSY